MAAGTVNLIEAKFSRLYEAGWNALKEIGTLKVEPIVFQSGATELDLLSKKIIDSAVERLKHYPNFRIIIKGHTSTMGDKEENLRLSKERAKAVARYLDVVYNVNLNRLKTVGYGGAKPLPRKKDESKRSWMYGLPRVELALVREDY